MSLFRIGPIPAAAIGTVLTLITVFSLVHFLIVPAKSRLEHVQQRYLAATQAASPGGYAKATADLHTAQKQLQVVKAQWLETQATLMPRYDVSNRVRAMDQLSYELTQNLGPDLEHHLRLYHGLATAQFTLPDPPVTPNDITNAPVIIPLGTITSRGSLPGVINQFRSWRYFNRVILLDNLALHGNSPYIQATYNATVYLLPQNDDKLPPPLPQAGGQPLAPGQPGGAAAPVDAGPRDVG